MIFDLVLCQKKLIWCQTFGTNFQLFCAQPQLPHDLPPLSVVDSGVPLLAPCCASAALSSRCLRLRQVRPQSSSGAGPSEPGLVQPEPPQVITCEQRNTPNHPITHTPTPHNAQQESGRQMQHSGHTTGTPYQYILHYKRP